MTQVLRFLIFFEITGLAGVPLAARALGRLPGAGIGFARVLAWLVLAWLVWMLGSIGLPNGTALAVACALLVVGAAAFLHRRRPRDAAPDPFRRRLFVATEVLFVASFLIAAFVGSYASDVWGTEKPMDMMLIASTLTSGSFPPHDAWLAGFDVNYYYLGHHMLALPIRLTGVEPSAGYNLDVAALFAVVVATAFATGATLAEAARRGGMALRRPLLAGALCVLALALAGSIHAGWDAWHADAWATYDWFDASRVIPTTINEFPFFSLNLGDLHAHAIAIPLTLLALAAIVQAGLHGPPLRSAEGAWVTFVTALSVAWLYAVNSWSWPVLAGLFALAIAVWITGPDAAGARRRAAGWGLLVLLGGLVLVLPFIVQFDPNAKHVTWTAASQREPFGTFLRHHLQLEGGLLWLMLAPLVAVAVRLRHRVPVLVGIAAAAAVLLPLLGRSNLAGAGVLAGLLAATTAAALTRRRPAERVLWAVAAGGLACLLAAEVGVVEDQFAGGPLERMNTVFKMGYQAWLLLAVFGAVALAAAAEWLPHRLPRIAWTVVAGGLIAIALGYTLVGTYARREAFKHGRQLDGRRWLEAFVPGDVEAIDWLRHHADGDAVVLEAVGDDYNPYHLARISTYTGLQTPVGWESHEDQWTHPIAGRRADVKTLYTSTDDAAVRGLIDRYGIDYAVVGAIERATYGDAAALTRAGREVFHHGGDTLYRFDGAS